MVKRLTTGICGIFVLLALSINVSAAGNFRINSPYVRFNTTVTSYAELRQSKLVRQGWDTSCGAAALATLLNYHHQIPVSEAAIALTLLKNTDPDRVRARGGFSLLDLKRYTEAVGLKGRGFGDMALDDLENFALPAILPIRIREFDHFVVYRKRLGNRILVGDPAFGNLTLKVAEFENMWQSKIAFYALSNREAEAIANSEKTKTLSPMLPVPAELAIPDLSYSIHIIHRLPAIPLTRSVLRIVP